MKQNNLIKPKKLSPGDTIGIISPAGAVREDKCWNKTVYYFENKGYKVKIAPHAKDKKAYLAGEDKNRLGDLISYFEDEEIKAIICSRGGYGVYRILSDLNFDIFRENPKILVGYSDITALLLPILDKSSLVTFHGPLALSDFGTDHPDNYTESSFFEILEGRVNLPYSYPNPVNYECINPGKTEGELICGNLAIISGLLGTPYFPDLTNKILLLEDVGEPLYRIDRMLMQLKLAGIFDKISGLLFGEFTSIAKSDNPDINKLSPVNIIHEILNGYSIPIGYGFAASHGPVKATLPLGVKYSFNSDNFNLSLQENYLT